MAKQRHLKHAPITEAIVDFRVRAKPGLDVNVFKSLQGKLSAEYPEVKEIKAFEAEIRIGSEGVQPGPVKHHGVIGLRFVSDDGLNLAQFRLDGFSFHRLKQYTSWNEIFPTVDELWARYVDVAEPSTVTRLALRYINRIELPAVPDGYQKFMTAPPPMPSAIPGRVSKFLTRVTIHDEEKKLDAHVTQALETQQADNKQNLILDIDAFKDFSKKGLEVHSDDIKRTLNALHGLKNRIFFESCTEDAIDWIERTR